MEVVRRAQVLVCFEGGAHSPLVLDQRWTMKERDESSITQEFIYVYLLNIYYGLSIVLGVWIYQ